MTAGALIRPRLEAVLFDLDGTLIDSAPDLAGACNDMRLSRGRPALPYAALRPMVGSGARGMVGRAFDVVSPDPRFPALRDEFLQRYEDRMTQETRIFADVARVLARFAECEMPWGIVTNKARRFSEPLVAALGLAAASAALVSGDSTPHAKPHPEPLFEAARRLRLEPADCWYVGDDLRDVQAGRAAGMTTVIAGWGYLGLGEPIDAWGADHVVELPLQLLTLLDMA